MSRRGVSLDELHGGMPRFVLITECLQNDFFLNNVSPVVLPEAARRMLLLSRRDFDLSLAGPRVSLNPEHLRQGPLGVFFELTIQRRRRGEDGVGTLHVVNIHQERTPDQMDDEAGRLQRYCEAGTWGAEYIDGLASELDPGGSASYFEEGSVCIHHVRSDSPFAFRPPNEQIGQKRKLDSSSLEDLLDVIVLGSDADQEQARALLRSGQQRRPLRHLARQIAEDEAVRSSAPVYLAVIGVCTDIHVRTLLFGLRDRYAIPDLVVSDTLTGAHSVGRHVSALDFAANLLDVDVIHGINELVRFLGTSTTLEDESSVVTSKPFAAYAAFEERTQRVIAQQEETLQAYLLLFEGRSLRVYRQIERANKFLIAWGTAFLSLTLLLVVLMVAFPGRIDPWLPLTTAGLSLAQFVTAFYSNPTNSLQQNLINLAAFRMILESHSLKSTFARLHLTPPRTGPIDTKYEAQRAKDEAEIAMVRTDALAAQIQVLNDIDALDYEALKQFSRLQGEDGEQAAPERPAMDSDAPAAPPPPVASA